MRASVFVAPLLTSVFFTLGLAGFSPSARADNSNTNRQLLPLGESQAFMGNTGVARAVDTGSVYYNPSGLAELEADRMSVTSSVYLRFKTRTEGLVNLDNTLVPYEASGFNTIPSFYAATFALGDWHGAISILVPTSLQVENRVPFSTPNTEVNVVQSTRSSDLWLGFSAAHAIGERWSVGVTVFGAQHQEAKMAGIDLGVNADPNGSAITALNQMSVNVIGLTAVAGVSFQATNWLRLGLRAQSPLIQLHGKADVYQVNRTTEAGTIKRTGEDRKDTDANYRLPFDFTLGAALSPASWLTLAADLSLQLGADYSSIPDSAMDERVNLKPTPRFNFGTELRALRWLPLRAGFSFNPSATADDSGTAGFLDEDYFGLTFGVGIKSSRVETGVGFFYLWANGRATPALAPGRTVDTSSQAMGGMLTASYFL